MNAWAVRCFVATVAFDGGLLYGAWRLNAMYGARAHSLAPDLKGIAVMLLAWGAIVFVAPLVAWFAAGYRGDGTLPRFYAVAILSQVVVFPLPYLGVRYAAGLWVLVATQAVGFTLVLIRRVRANGDD